MRLAGILRRVVDPRVEDGITLVLALAILMLFSITTVTAVTMATSTQDTAGTSSASQAAAANAEAGVNDAERALNAVISAHNDPTAANLLGCTNTAGPSNCSSPTPQVVCITVASPCTAGSAGTASYYGFFSGTNAQTSNGVAVPASTWLIISTGYVKNPIKAGVVSRSTLALLTPTTSSLNDQQIAAQWNHIFITAQPTNPDSCQLDFRGAGGGAQINVPIYTLGNVCLGTVPVLTTTQPIDFMVGGKLYLTSGTVGTSGSPIYSGVVQGGCTNSITAGVNWSTTACSNWTSNYFVQHPEAYAPHDAPSVTAAEDTFDPGPLHTCLAGTTPAPLPDSAFDSSANDASEPNNSGSTFTGNDYPTSGSHNFELVPSTSYACISKTNNGTDTGYLIWNNSGSQITVPVYGTNVIVPDKTLAIHGGVFVDANMTISRSFTYSGVGVVENSGWTELYGNNLSVCPTAVTNCASSTTCPTNWEGSSGNNSMLTLVPLNINNTTSYPARALIFGESGNDNGQVFVGSLWTPPTSTVYFDKNNDLVAGPMSIGSFDTTFNNATLCPLPTINDMDKHVPQDPNSGLKILPPVYQR